MFTSTGVLDGYGMWRCLLRGYESSTTLFLRPWYIWQLELRPRVRIYEIYNASRWVDLITAHPRIERGFLHPDWAAVASNWDAIHITLRAITAAQGMSFTTAYGPTVAPYWDVESTFWLRWCFTTSALVETIS